MRLYADFAVLNGGGGPSGVAHRLLVEAGYRPEVEYLPYGRPSAELVGLTERTQLPVLVLAGGNVIASLPGILAWLTAQGGDRRGAEATVRSMTRSYPASCAGGVCPVETRSAKTTEPSVAIDRHRALSPEPPAGRTSAG